MSIPPPDISIPSNASPLKGENPSNDTRNHSSHRSRDNRREHPSHHSSRNRSREHRDRDHHSRNRDRDDRDYRRSRDNRDRYDRDRRDRDYDRERERSYDKDREARRAIEEKARKDAIEKDRLAREAELNRVKDPVFQATKDERTVFLQQIHPKVDERALFEYFSACGTVLDVRLLCDPRTGKSKGVAYIEFESPDSTIGALALSGQLIGGYPVTITCVAVDKQRVPQSVLDQLQRGFRVSLTGLHPSLTEADIRPVLSIFGEVEKCIQEKDPSGSFVSYTVQFKKKVDAIECFRNLEGFEILEMQWTARPEFPIEEALRAPVPKPVPQARSSVTTAPPPVSISKSLNLPSVGVPSTYVSLKNMFNNKEVRDADEYRDIELDVKEAMDNAGANATVIIDKSSNLILLKFPDTAAAEKVVNKMHGRSYHNREVHAEFISKNMFQLYLS